jgi:hypothetical protein
VPKESGGKKVLKKLGLIDGENGKQKAIAQG